MQRRFNHALVLASAIVVSVLLLPFLGALAVGRLPPSLFTFPPPSDIPADLPGCSWFGRAVLPLAMSLSAVWLLFRWNERRRFPDGRVPEPPPARSFPIWGWCAVAWTIAWWVLSWTRFPWFERAQLYTFFPLWMGFIVTVNALTWRRGGNCTMHSAPRRWLSLFLISAAFWWGFEWLNRFVLNWHYLGADNFTATTYAIHASVCFSTVLPAVLAVREWLATHPAWNMRCSDGPKWRWLARRRSGAALIAIGGAGLLLTGARPHEAYPALWAAPLLLALGTQILTHRPGWWTDLAVGDWRVAGSWAAAALTCGFFWEMWNLFSRAKWIYTIPYLDCWHIFEMPMPGYLGYLPFGLECAIVVQWCGVDRRARPLGRQPDAITPG